jgi:hypothetical protein
MHAREFLYSYFTGPFDRPSRRMVEWTEEKAKNCSVSLDEYLAVKPYDILPLRQYGVTECSADFERFVGHTFYVSISGSDTRTFFQVDRVHHSRRHGTQVHITYADGDIGILSPRECDLLMNTVVEWPELFTLPTTPIYP